MKSYLKPLPSRLPYVLWWIAGVACIVFGTIAVGLFWVSR